MNLKSNMINNAIIGFITTFKSGSKSFIVKRLSAFLLSLIIFVSSVFCQYCTAVVSAAEVGAIVAVDLIAELAITGGIVAGIFRTVEIIQGEVSSGYGFGSDGLDEYALNVNGILTDKVNSGEITNQQAGTVKKLSGVPVEIICPIYGTYQFLCTNELCNKLRIENPSTDDAVRAIVNTYWSSVDILDQSTFEEIASDPKNWVSSLDILDSGQKAIVNQSVFQTYGEYISTIDESFFTTGKAGTIYWSGYTGEYIMQSQYVNRDWDYFVITCPNMNDTAYPAISVMYHNDTWADPHAYVQYQFQQAYGRQLLGSTFSANGFQEISIPWERLQALGYPWTVANPLDITEVFPNWGSMWGIENTDAIDLMDWMYADGRFWNTDILDLAIDEIADTVDARVETGEDAGVQDIPIGLPIDIPIEGEGDVAWPSDLTDEDFDDPPAYPRTDEWADADVNFPPYDPDPDDPDPDDPDDPDNPSVDPDGELPPLAVPQLLTLFPFCIPFDIHKALMFFETDISEGGSPEFRIPFRIILPNNQSIIYDDIVINFDGYDIPLILYYIKAALVVTHCIVLGYATTKFIY